MELIDSEKVSPTDEVAQAREERKAVIDDIVAQSEFNSPERLFYQNPLAIGTRILESRETSQNRNSLIRRISVYDAALNILNWVRRVNDSGTAFLKAFIGQADPKVFGFRFFSNKDYHGQELVITEYGLIGRSRDGDAEVVVSGGIIVPVYTSISFLRLDVTGPGNYRALESLEKGIDHPVEDDMGPLSPEGSPSVLNRTHSTNGSRIYQILREQPIMVPGKNSRLNHLSREAYAEIQKRTRKSLDVS